MSQRSSNNLAKPADASSGRSTYWIAAKLSKPTLKLLVAMSWWLVGSDGWNCDTFRVTVLSWTNTSGRGSIKREGIFH